MNAEKSFGGLFMPISKSKRAGNSGLPLALIICSGILFAQPSQAQHEAFFLTNGWTIQSSAKIQTNGEVISATGFATTDWYAARVPSTVMGTLVDDGVYADPFFGMNLRSVPGVSYPIGVNFSGRPFPADSPFKVPWWYRKEFQLAERPDGQYWLNFDGINYSANIWLNGKLIADTNAVQGAYRTYSFNVSQAALPGKTNVLAVEILPPDVNSLAITWVDWNPSPPDKEMGLWRDVSVITTGSVAMKYPQVLTKVDMPSLAVAHLLVSAELDNTTDKSALVRLKGRIGDIEFEEPVGLAPHENKRFEFKPEYYPQLNIQDPRLWWPAHVGPQDTYELRLAAEVNGKQSDSDRITFGIREATSELNEKGYRVFKINGKPILVRGGGWAPDMFLRNNPQREAQEIKYVADMNLNAIRFEGKTERGPFLDLCDREGIMVIAGWCCCDFWEKWSKWKDNDYAVATESLRDQVQRIRNHPSIITYWYGSDNPPNSRAESNYLAVFKELKWPNSAQASASGKPPAVGEPTGIRMTGPYDYVPPVYWYTDTRAGGAYCFNTETSPGPAIPPIESLRRMLPKDHLWPIDEYWNYHAGGGAFKTLNIFTTALNNRLGEATNAEDYARKAQVMTYDGERAMFEAYARNKYDSTGVIQWMMNNAWPSMIWHLYDYYLRPGGGYFGAKKACEPLHIQYSYDDRSVVVVNGFYLDQKGLKATAKLYDLDMTEKFSQSVPVDIGADGTKRVIALPAPTDLSPVYFAKLTLESANGNLVSQNFYWLSTQIDTMGQPRAGSDWYYTPTKQYADFKALNQLPATEVKVSAKSQLRDENEVTRVTIENPGKSLAFFVRLKVNAGQDGEEVLPVIWQDNYFSLLPGEKREVTAVYERKLLGKAKPMVEVSGWNVADKTVAAPR